MKRLLLSSLLVLPACITQPPGLARSTVPVRDGEYTVLGRVSGSAWGFTLLGIPLSEPRQAGLARDRAVESAGGDGLVNVSVSSTVYFLIIFNVTRATVTGDAFKYTKS